MKEILRSLSKKFKAEIQKTRLLLQKSQQDAHSKHYIHYLSFSRGGGDEIVSCGTNSWSLFPGQERLSFPIFHFSFHISYKSEAPVT